LAKPYETTEIPTLKQQIPNTKIKVLSQVGAIINKMRQLTDEQKIINDVEQQK
jgi:hypothetical protein